MVPIKEHIANTANYGVKRSLSSIKFLVIHYTANDGDTDENNGKYFANTVTKTSAHYFVDDDSITRSVPDDYAAWHCGTRGTYKHKTCRNNNSIGIEICDDVKNGTIYPSAKTIQNVLELTRSLMKKYNIPAENVIRHYDVTGKLCPAYWVDDKAWKEAFWNHLKDDNTTVEEKPFEPFRVRVTPSALNIRAGAGMNFPVVGCIRDFGVYTIVDQDGIWGRLKSGAGWISLKYTTKL